MAFAILRDPALPCAIAEHVPEHTRMASAAPAVCSGDGMGRDEKRISSLCSMEG
jgi:hypothetical protein